LAQVASTRTPAVDLRAETPSVTRLLSLQEEAPVEVTTTSAEEETLANARISPSRASSETTGGTSVRQPRYVIDARPPSFEATKVSFSF